MKFQSYIPKNSTRYAKKIQIWCHRALLPKIVSHHLASVKTDDDGILDGEFCSSFRVTHEIWDLEIFVHSNFENLEVELNYILRYKTNVPMLFVNLFIHIRCVYGFLLLGVAGERQHSRAQLLRQPPNLPAVKRNWQPLILPYGFSKFPAKRKIIRCCLINEPY